VTEYKFPQKIYFNKILKKIAKIITTNTKNAKVLDYGCGAGLLKSFVKNINTSIDVTGYDVDSSLSEIKNPKVSTDTDILGRPFRLKEFMQLILLYSHQYLHLL
jgi:predicted RNA methylase